MTGRPARECVGIPWQVFSYCGDPVMKDMEFTLMQKGTCDCVVGVGLTVGPPHFGGAVLQWVSWIILGVMRATFRTPTESLNSSMVLSPWELSHVTIHLDMINI